MTIKLIGSFAPWSGAVSVGDLGEQIPTDELLTMESGDTLTMESGVELALDEA